MTFNMACTSQSKSSNKRVDLRSGSSSRLPGVDTLSGGRRHGREEGVDPFYC